MNFRLRYASLVLCSVLLCSVLLIGPALLLAQVPKYDVPTTLREAEYVLNRYQELSARFNTAGWDAPADTKKLVNDARKVVDRNVEQEKIALTPMLVRSNWSSIELLDLYSELQEVSSQLASMTTDTFNFGGSEQNAVDYTSLAAKSQITASKLYVMLRLMMEHQEAQLTACYSKPSK